MGLLLVLLCACSVPLAKQKGLTDEILFDRGMKQVEAKKYTSAIEHFQLLLERFPASPAAPRAQLALADARRERNEFTEAEAAYDDFLRLYPANDNVPYALFRKGELLLREASDTGRDPTKTREAVKTFTTLLERNPAGPYARTAADRIRELRLRLAGQEEAVVRHYIATRKYDSAEFRARRAIDEYKDTAALPSIMSLLAQALDRQGKKDEAAEVRGSLKEKFPHFGEKTK